MMRAMLMEQAHAPLRWKEFPLPERGAGQVLIRVRSCAVCRTDLHILDGELPRPKLPLILGHEIIGTIVGPGPGGAIAEGSRIGVPWLAWSDGQCSYCLSGRENLCDRARFTGYDVDGGYAEYAVADARFCFPIPDRYGDAAAAPLMCAGLIGFRSLKMTGQAERLGLYGIGAAAHILIQVARHQGRRVYAFTRPGDVSGQQFALSLGADWAAGSDQPPPVPLDAAIIFAPVGSLIPTALRAVAKGGVVVCGGIHMSSIPAFDYELLWGERIVRSVANLTRADGTEFLALASRTALRVEVQTFPLVEANRALAALRSGALQGAAVLVPEVG